MNTYHVQVARVEYEYATIEAESEEDAQRIFEEQGGHFSYESWHCNINLDEIGKLIIIKVGT